MSPKKLAIAIENTGIVLAALVPWSVAMAVPFRTLEVKNISAIYACYSYILPLWNFFVAIKNKNKNFDVSGTIN